MDLPRNVRYCSNFSCPHFELTGNPAEYLEHVEICADCGSRLQAEPPRARDGLAEVIPTSTESVGEVDAEETFVCIATFHDTDSMERAMEMLERESIPFIASGPNSSSVRGETSRPFLHVPESSLPLAETLLVENGLDLQEAAAPGTTTESFARHGFPGLIRQLSPLGFLLKFLFILSSAVMFFRMLSEWAGW